MRLVMKFIAAAAIGFLALSTSGWAASQPAMNKNEIEKIVRDYLLEHPEILREMSDKLDAKDKAATETARMDGLKANAKMVFQHAGDAVAGNPKGDVTLVEFMDYNCSWCRKSVTEIQALSEGDKNLRIVFKEFPIFGKGSEYAARAALAAEKQGKYWQLHQALFAEQTQITEEVVDSVAANLGIDVAKMKADMKDKNILNTISANYDLAKALHIDGTPAFIIDDQIIPGYVPADQLTEQITTVRTNGCKMC